jgi:hypothetical protein
MVAAATVQRSKAQQWLAAVVGKSPSQRQAHLVNRLITVGQVSGGSPAAPDPWLCTCLLLLLLRASRAKQGTHQ